ncbi:SpoIIE family protein phosphatase [candidate division KSB1 bacterium]|nr:SpoIIE family protein phosphatase [candidate division KSB1 bacterium]
MEISPQKSVVDEATEVETMRHELHALQEKVIQLQSLIEVTSIISSVLDLDRLMQLVMEKAQSVMHAEASSVLLLNEKENRLECEIALGEVGEQVKRKVQLEIGQGIAGWVAQTGKPLIVEDVASDSRFYARSDELTGFKTRSILAAPLIVKDKIIGVAEVINPLESRKFNRDDLDIFLTFCRQVALAIENAKIHRYLIEKQRLDQQLESAHAIQQSFMPQAFPQSPEGAYSVWAKNIPAISVGGDFYDFIEFDAKKLGIVIGDVSGKGIPAALFMARLVSDFRFFTQSEKRPEDTMSAMNNCLAERSLQGMFVTLSYLLLDIQTGELTIADGGHLPPIWVHHRQAYAETIDQLDCIPLGIQRDASFSSSTIQLEHGDSVILVTDGVIEAKNKRGEQLSMKGLLDIDHVDSNDTRQVVTTIIDATLSFSRGTRQHDDITVVCLTWN